MSRVLMHKTRGTRAFMLLAAMSLFLSPVVFGHTGSILLPEGCGSCHVGHGQSGEPMLNASEEEFCYECHGSSDNQARMKAVGKLAPAANLADVEQEFKKVFRHPVEDGSGHSPTERLPDFNGSAASHAECVDCHNPHQRIMTGVSRVADVAGFSLAGQYVEEATTQAEICFKCHVDLTGGRESTKDLRRQFATTVRSMHPVTKPVFGRRQPSLREPLAAGATMKCTDCHRSDRADAPAGPHGSIYEFILSGNYNTDVRADESALAYQFCYSCHDRSSILNNESFPLHREHIEGDLLKGIPGTSCYTCHASHSSEDHANLIRFNPEAVGRSTSSGRLDYRTTGNNSGECYLTCHGQNHDPAAY